MVAGVLIFLKKFFQDQRIKTRRLLSAHGSLGPDWHVLADATSSVSNDH